MRVVVTGAAGLLGRALGVALSDRHDVTPFDVEDFDITDLATCRGAIAASRPDAVIHAAAWTNVDACESDPDRAYRVNGVGSGNVALAARDAGAWLLAVGTDYVFDGTKDEPYDEVDPVSPLGVYGRSKLLGERMIRDSGARWSILRTQALFGVGGRNFVDAILERARSGEPLRVVGDQRTCPTFAPHLAEGIVRILEEGTESLYHVSSTGDCSWLEFAAAILEECGIDVPLETIGSEELTRPAPRPRNGVLRNMHLELTIGDRMPHWREGLRAYLRERGDLS